jgi:cobalt-zinc-cadmium efflux system outer membrane protein
MTVLTGTGVTMKLLKTVITVLTLISLVLMCWATPRRTGAGPPEDHLAVSETPIPSENAPARNITDLDQTSTLADYLKYAALNNPGLEAAFNQWKAALERVTQVASLPDPRFNYAYYIEEVETRVGPQRQMFGISQTFPWFGKLKLKGDAALEAAHAEKEQYEKTKLTLFHRVKSAYYEYYYIGRAVAITREHINLLVNLESVARTRFKTGHASHTAVIQAQVEVGKLDDRFRAIESLQEPIVAKLNAVLNRPSDAPLPWPKTIPYDNPVFTDKEALEWLAERNPDVKRLEFLEKKEQFAVKLARKNYYPDITLGLDYVDTDEALMPGAPDSGKDPLIAKASVNVPIWYRKYRAGEKEAGFRRAAMQEQRVNTENQLGADLKLALYHFRDAERKIDLYRDTLIPKGDQSLRVAQLGFQAGKVSFISLIDAERLLLEFQLAYERALADRAGRLSEIETFVSKDLSGNGHGGMTNESGDSGS